MGNYVCLGRHGYLRGCAIDCRGYQNLKDKKGVKMKYQDAILLTKVFQSIQRFCHPFRSWSRAFDLLRP